MWKFLIGAIVGYLAARGSSSKNSDAIKPLAKAALKAGIQFAEKGYEAASHLRESVEDVFAEARADLDAKAAAEQREQEEEAAAEPAPKRRRRRPSQKRAKPQPESDDASARHH